MGYPSQENLSAAAKNIGGIMTTEKRILLRELLEACCAALAFIDQEAPEDFALGEDECVKERLKAAVAKVQWLFEDSLPTIH